MKYSQINTKPSCAPRKLIGGVTQQYAQPEPQNSEVTLHGEVNCGREKPQTAGSCFCLQREEGDGGGEYGERTPQKQKRESGKLETAAGTEIRREKGERRRFKFH